MQQWKTIVICVDVLIIGDINKLGLERTSVCIKTPDSNQRIYVTFKKWHRFSAIFLTPNKMHHMIDFHWFIITGSCSLIARCNFCNKKETSHYHCRSLTLLCWARERRMFL